MRTSKNFGIFISFQHATREFLKNTDRQNEKKSVKLIKVRLFCVVLLVLEQTDRQTAADSNCGSIYKKLLVSVN
jgi:hypothetical protein